MRKFENGALQNKNFNRNKMVTYSNERTKQIQKRKKGNKFKKKHKQTKSENKDQSTQGQKQLAVIDQTGCTKKIQKLIEDVAENTTREKIVLLFIEAAQKAENCLDFQIGFWLDKYNEFADEINFTEAALLIINAANIYGRKVDFLHQFVSSSISQDESDIGINADSPQSAPKPRKQAIRRPLSLHDRLYEAEMLTKQFKTMPLAKTTEMLSTLTSTEAPKNYFRKWKEYKAWRLNHKKRMKGAVPYSIVGDDSYLHPAMWRLSCIEDFDYDDDVDTKRSYRMFTHYTEHRYGTLVPDINFIMHFKVKDYIEAEEDEIEIMKILGLPPPPSRQWPPFCKTSYSKEYVKETYNIDIDETSEDYIKKYVALEDIVLKEEVYEIDADLFRSASEAQRNCRNVVNVIENTYSGINQDKSPTIAPITTAPDKLPTIDMTSIATLEVLSEALDVSSGVLAENTCQYADMLCVETATNGLVPESKNTENPVAVQMTMNLADSANLESINLTTESTQLADTFENDAISELNNNINLIEGANLEELNSTHTSVQISKSTATNLNNNLIEQPEGTRVSTKDAYQLIAESIQNNISSHVVVRLSIDEGVAFGDLDDLDRAMLSPVVELIDILPIKEEVNDYDESIKNLFAIDKSFLSHKENFNLPFDLVYKEPPIKYNIFKLPESKLRKEIRFSLPSDYNLYKTCRLKRKKDDNGRDRAGKINPKVFKMNEQNITNIPITPPATPRPEDDFLGFDESETSFSVFQSNELLSSTLLESMMTATSRINDLVISPNRTISRDSGIGLVTVSDSQITNSDNNPLSGISILQETSHDMGAPNAATPSDIAPVAENGKKVSCIGESNAIELLTKRISDKKSAILENAQEKSKDNVVEQRINEMNEMRERIQKWHRHLKPILARSKDRHHFDIFAIGTEIIDTFSTQNIAPENASITLQDIMHNHDPSYLSRYFLSMLQLINTNNIEIKVENCKPEIPVPLSDIHLKLLSRKRHSISIEDDVGAHAPKSRKQGLSAMPVEENISGINNKEVTPANRIQQKPSIKKTHSTSIYNQGASTSKTTSISESFPNLTSNIKAPTLPTVKPSTSTPPTVKPSTSTPLTVKPFNFTSLTVKLPTSTSLCNKKQSIGDKPVYSVCSEATSLMKNSEAPVSNDLPIHIYNTEVSTSKSISISINSIETSNIINPDNPIISVIPSEESPSIFNRKCAGNGEEILKKYKEKNREKFSKEVDAHCNDYMRLLSQKHDINLQLYFSPEGIANVTTSEEQDNSFARNCLIYPKRVQTQSIGDAKRCRLTNDDLDSGIFSEFSSQENNSLILE